MRSEKRGPELRGRAREDTEEQVGRWREEQMEFGHWKGGRKAGREDGRKGGRREEGRGGISQPAAYM